LGRGRKYTFLAKSSNLIQTYSNSTPPKTAVFAVTPMLAVKKSVGGDPPLDDQASSPLNYAPDSA